MPLFTPTNQKRLTNVAVVRLKKGGKRYEIACYPNKVSAWREKLEKDLDEVLQARQVFTNVSKGEGAKKEELEKVFNTQDIDKICIEILEKGELQVSAKEREDQLDSQFKEVASIVASKCINPITKKVYTVTSIEQAMKDCHIALRPNRNSKQQALDAIRKLKDGGLKIQRARMRLSIAVSKRQVVDKLRPLAFKIENESYDEDSHVTTLTVVCEPSDYRTIDELVSKSAVGAKDGAAAVAKLEIVDLQVPLDEDEDEDEDEKPHESHAHGKGQHHASSKQHHDEAEETGEKKAASKKKAQSKKAAGDSDEEDNHRGHRKHQDLSEIEAIANQASAKAGKKGQKGPKPATNKADDSDEESAGHSRRGARGKFVDVTDD